MKNKQLLVNILDNSKIFLKNNSSTLLTIGASVGMVLTVVSTAKATIKAVEIYNEIEVEKKRKPTRKEVVLNTFSVYITPFVLCSATLACVHGMKYFDRKKQASLISAYQFINGTFNEYKSKVKQTYGEDAYKKLLDQIYIEHADKQLVYAQNLVGNDVLLPDGDGEIKTFYDHFGDRFFQCTMEQVLQAEYHLNRNFSLRGEASVNEFNSFLGIAPTDDGDMLNWSMDDGFTWIDFDNRKVTMDDGSCFYAIEMPFEPNLMF